MKRKVFAITTASVAITLALTNGCGIGACEDGGKVYAHGETWTCSDGCNQCGCQNGTINSTLMACGWPNARACDEGGRSHPHGTRWACADGCSACRCADGVVTEDSNACASAGAGGTGEP